MAAFMDALTKENTVEETSFHQQLIDIRLEMVLHQTEF